MLTFTFTFKHSVLMAQITSLLSLLRKLCMDLLAVKLAQPIWVSSVMYASSSPVSTDIILTIEFA